MAILSSSVLLCLLLGWAWLSDVRCRRIPNPCTVGGSLVLIVVHAASGGPLAGRLLAGLATFVLLGSVSLLRPGSLGMGDVKLASLIAIATGPLALVALPAGFLSALVYCLPALARGARRKAGAVTVALAPHLALGAILAMALVG